MKNSETERELTELIKSTLDNYHEDYIPGAWENFADNRRRRKRIILFRIATGIAACLMIGWLGFHSINQNSHIKPETAVVNSNPDKAPVVKEPLVIDKPIAKNNETEQKTNNNNNILSSSKKNIAPVNVYKSDYKAVADNQPTLTQLPEIKDSAAREMITIPSATDTLKSFLASSANPVDSTADLKGFQNLSGLSETPKSQSIEEQLNLQRIAENSARISVKRKIRFGINISPGVNSTQTGSAFNYSGGINTDIALFSNIQLSTGLQIEHQSVINGGQNNSAVSSALTKADLVNLDIPLNITWKFFSDKSKSFYVSGGVSSLAYLSEKYDKTTYTQQISEVRTMALGVEKVAYSVEDLQSTVQTTEPSFNSFDIAGRLNILFGMEQRLSPKLYLHFEPYIKIPVSGLASENLRFSTGGITCKISF